MQDVLFPSDFERLYNLPFAYADDKPQTGFIAAHSVTEPVRLGRLQDEIGKAMHRSLTHKRMKARGGDLMTPLGQKLGRLLVKKRGEEYAERKGTPTVPTPASSQMPLTGTESAFESIEDLLISLLNLIETGAKGDQIGDANRILQGLLKDGDKLSASQLESIYTSIGDIVQVIPRFRNTTRGVVPDVKQEMKYIYNNTALILDSARRAIQYLLAYVNYSPLDRKRVLSSVRTEVRKYMRTKQNRDPVSYARLVSTGPLPRLMREAPYLRLGTFEEPLEPRAL